MRVQIGAGSRPLEGWVNVEPRRGEGLTYGHACDLPFEDSTVDALFVNAVFEHIYRYQVPSALTEWKRVLKPDGGLLVLGIPDFEQVARLYLDRAPGITHTTFDMHDVNRYTHGWPEASMDVDWSTWDPAEHLDDAPSEYLVQLHKAVYDAEQVAWLFSQAGFHPQMFRYCYPGELHPLNLGVCCGPQGAFSGDWLAEYVDLETDQAVA